MKLTMKVESVMEDEKFKKEVAYGVDLKREMLLKNDELIVSKRLFLRMVDIHDKEVDKVQNIYNKTKNKRIRNKLDKKLNIFVEKYTY